jgi:hypothetical protein
MANAVSSQTLVDGAKNLVVKLTFLGDGSGEESAVLKVDVSTYAGTPSRVRIKKIHYSVAGMVATLLWDATTDVRIVDLQGDGHMDCCEFGGLYNNAGTGITGDIMLTTTGAGSGDSYTIILEMIKD